MKRCVNMLGFSFLLSLTVFTRFAFSAGLEKVNLGIYGAQVQDITAYDNSGTTEILIGIDSIKGVYRWNTSTSSSWEAVTYPDIVGKCSEIEANLVSGYEDDIYAIISDTTGASQIYASDSGGSYGSWSNISTFISAPGVLTAHSSGLYVGTFMGDIYRNTGGTGDSFTLLYSFGSGSEITSVSVYDANTIFVMVRTSGSVVTPYRLDGSPLTATALTNPTSTASGSGSVEVEIIGVDPTDANTLFIAGGSVNPQVYKTTTGDAPWTSSWDFESSGINNFPGGYPQYIKFNNNRVFISASVLDGSSGSWSHAPILSSTVGSYTVDTHVNDGALDINPNDTTNIYMATDWAIGELSYSSGTWTAGSEVGNNNGIEGVVLNDIDFYEYSSTHKELWIAAKSGAGRAVHFDPTDSSSTASSSDWIFPIFPETDGPPVTEVTINPNDPSIVFVGNNAGRVYMTTTGTSTSPTWTKVFQAEDYPGEFGSTRPDHSDITAIDFVPSVCSRIYIAGKNWETEADGGIFYSDDGGATWTADTINSTGVTIDFPVNTLWVTDNEVWAGVGGENSAETGLRWRLSICSTNSFWTPTTGTSIDNEIVTSIDGTTISGDVTVYIATQGGVYKGEKPSGSSSWTWQTVTPSSATSTDFTSVAINPSDADNAYAAVGNCIYETTDGGSTWAIFGSSCSDSHEDVNVLKYDDILAGTAIGLFSYSSTDTTPTPTPTFTLTPTPTAIPDITASPAPKTTPTPNEDCRGSSMQVTPDTISLSVGESENVSVKITGNNNCLVEGAKVKAKVTRKGKRLLSLSSKKEVTDESGEAVFTVTANKSGKAKLMFKSKNLKEKIVVTIEDN
ncbi:MAG: hypothetical protein E3K37_17910 [Candidatus Kuenenia sp.]|nr:hypothetical protein [Candidatus Kuenenia hertensis]